MTAQMQYRKFFMGIAWLIAAIPFSAIGKETILWQTYHRPPGTFNYGENKGQGFVQKTLQLLIDKMPEYQHEMPATTLARAISDIKSGHKVCHPALYITPEREANMYLSNASILNPTNRIIAKLDTVAPFLENNRVNLEKLLHHESLTVGHVQGRSYGQAIDNIFNTHSQKKKLLPLQNIDLARIFKMVELNRVNVTIAYPFEIQHYLKSNPQAKVQLSAFPIANIPLYDVGSVACPKNAWGKQVIQKVNTILKEIKPTIEYQQALTTWRESERNDPTFIKYYREYFLTH